MTEGLSQTSIWLLSYVSWLLFIHREDVKKRIRKQRWLRLSLHKFFLLFFVFLLLCFFVFFKFLFFVFFFFCVCFLVEKERRRLILFFWCFFSFFFAIFFCLVKKTQRLIFGLFCCCCCVLMCFPLFIFVTLQCSFDLIVPFVTLDSCFGVNVTVLRCVLEYEKSVLEFILCWLINFTCVVESLVKFVF